MSVLKEIEKLADDFGGDVENVKKELKKVQSQKCRLLKQKAKKGYEAEMSKVLKYEQALKEVRSYLEPKKITVTTMTESDIKLLNFDETIKAIKSIQSKKCLSQYKETMDEYNEACRIEDMLLNHKKEVTPVPENCVEKSRINDLIANLSNLDQKIDKDYIIEQLKGLL
jgi:Fe2+ transport system protein B